MRPILSLILSTLVFFAMILALVLKPTAARRLSTVFMTIGVIGGLLIYGTGYTEAFQGDLAMTVIRTPMTVIRMFIGVNDLDTIKNTVPVSTRTGLSVFWTVHLMAFYSMASAAMYTIGAGVLRNLRFVLARHGDLTLIYGINEKSVMLGHQCIERGKTSVVFIAESADEATVNDLNTAGMSVLTGNAAVQCEQSVIRKLRIRKRRLTVYALDRAEDENLFYALRLKAALEKAGVPVKNTQITLPGAEDILAPMLQASEAAYGFGYVNVYDAADLAARALIRTCPPWSFMHFNADGFATEDFDCVVAGFGRHGQAALKKLVMNGQFAGSTFHAAVFSPNVENESGFLEADNPELLRQYDIRRYAADARSSAFYEYIRTHLGSLKMIVVCTGDEAMNREISDNLMLYLRRNHAERICVVQCDDSGVRYQETLGKPIIRTEICSLDYLSAKETDRLAILLNSTYDSSDRSDWEKWMACDSFGKMSSRASADFLPAFIRISGSSSALVRVSLCHGLCPDEPDGIRSQHRSIYPPEGGGKAARISDLEKPRREKTRLPHPLGGPGQAFGGGKPRNRTECGLQTDRHQQCPGPSEAPARGRGCRQKVKKRSQKVKKRMPQPENTDKLGVFRIFDMNSQTLYCNGRKKSV